MKFAIVESGGKQYRAVEGATIEVDLLPVQPGDKLDLPAVLLVSDGEKTSVGAPLVKGAAVKATVVDHTKGPKIDVFRYRPKKHYRVKTGHRQQYTLLMVDSITVE
jgi:large subunit ribosomal protein L21